MRYLEELLKKFKTEEAPENTTISVQISSVGELPPLP